MHKKWKQKRTRVFYQLDGVMKTCLGIIHWAEYSVLDNTKTVIFTYPNHEFYIHDSYLENVILVCADGTVIDEL